uniref:Serpentine Receptor, class T n=1 Tax=Panagrellus redivivus TaxID=6233 RepID=A0A7E4ZQ65_PANRE
MSNSTVIEQIGSLVPPINYSALTLDDLEHPRLVSIYSIYWEVSLIVTTIFFAFMLYMIITKSSKEMSGYKWFLVHQLTWSYVFDVYLGLWKPVPFWPFYLAYSAGVFSDISDKYVPIQLLILVVNAIGMGFAIYISGMHRYMQASPFSKLYDIYNTLWRRILTYIIIFPMIVAVICAPLLYALPDQTSLKASIASRFPVVKQLVQKYPSMLGYDPAIDNNASTSFLLILILALLLVIASIHMLFRALMIQVSVAGVLLILPITTCFFLLLFGVTWVSAFSLFAIAVIGIHPIADFIVLTFYIKSYREYVKNLLKKGLLKVGFKVKTAPAQFLPASSTGIHSSFAIAPQ